MSMQARSLVWLAERAHNAVLVDKRIAVAEVIQPSSGVLRHGQDLEGAWLK